MTNRVSTVSRRLLLTGGASLLVAPMVIQASRAVQSNSVTVCSWGGSFQEISVNTVYTPFTQETGIKVNVVPAPDLAKIKAQMLLGSVEWDIYENFASVTASASKMGFWEKLDPSMFDLSDLVVQPTSDSITFQITAEGMAWDPKKYGPGKHPSTFAECFDPQKFPGRRAFLANPNGMLETALLADGVAPKDIYPLDLDRAFKSLDRIKSNVASWATTPQTISLLQTGEVDFSYTYSNRVKATTEPGGGLPLAFSFDQNLFDSDNLVVLKGAPNRDNAMKLLAYFLRPEVQARMQNQLGLIPVSRKAASMLSPEARKWQPDMTSSNSLMKSATYWADNLEPVSIRFKEWLRG